MEYVTALSFFQVLQFREQKLEALRLQSAIAAKQQEEEEWRLQVAEEKERRRRDLQNQKVRPECTQCGSKLI